MVHHIPVIGWFSLTMPLKCSAYAAQRLILMEELHNLLPVNMFENQANLEIVLLFGSPDLDFHTNLAIFTYVYSFISTTGRFTF